MKALIVLIAMGLVLAGCGANAEPSPTQSADAGQAMPEGHPPIGGESEAAPAGSQTLTGKVAEAIEGGGYTYIRMTSATGETWVAVPKTTVEVGQELTVAIQMTMNDFESTALGRKFESLAFATVGDGTSAPSAHGMSGMGMGMGHGGAKPQIDLDNIKVEKAAGANAKTVAELWAQRASLADQTVVVRGQVVKFLPSIMGRNWVHLRDGTGSSETADNDITITTDATVKVGDVVVTTGIVRVDKDLGAGYSYPVILEEGKFAN